MSDVEQEPSVESKRKTNTSSRIEGKEWGNEEENHFVEQKGP